MTDIAKYLIRSPKQVLTYLNMLSTERCLISASFGEDDKDTFLTAIVDIDEKKQTLIIDCGPKEYLNKRLLHSAIIKCSTKYKGIKVLFEGRQVKKAGTISQSAFSIPIPSSIYWIQRRQFYRIKSPLSKNSYCSITFATTEQEDEKTVDFKLFDLSISGFSFITDSLEQAEDFPIDSEFKSCKLVLNGTEAHEISFACRNTFVINQNNPTKSQKIGCGFDNLGPRAENAFLRYMQEIEREIKNKLK